MGKILSTGRLDMPLILDGRPVGAGVMLRISWPDGLTSTEAVQVHQDGWELGVYVDRMVHGVPIRIFLDQHERIEASWPDGG